MSLKIVIIFQICNNAIQILQFPYLLQKKVKHVFLSEYKY